MIQKSDEKETTKRKREKPERDTWTQERCPPKRYLGVGGREKKRQHFDLTCVLTNNNSFLGKRANLKAVRRFDFSRLTGLFLATQ